ncbi:MAG: Phosphatidate cytidylyltransferase, partial [Actinomycetia bacterium]|nr:Phosphatidate cytidylyltransferase [Actinomycetes bacterium]
MAWDRPDEDKTAGDKTEGVRIIGAEEAAEALERGDVAPRRGEGELKYGDRPARPPEDARPAVRFPLPADEADALRPRVVPTTPPPAAAPMPHWTDPPTGEVPKIVPEGVEGRSDDLEAWSTFATSGPRWRDQAGDWDDADFDAADLGHDESTRVGALDDRERPAPDDFFSVHAEEDLVTIDEVPPRVAAPPVPRPRPRRAPGASVASGRDMPTAIATGVGLLVLALILFKIGPSAVLGLVAAIIVLSAAELFAALQRGGYQPATLLGLVASGGLVLSAYWKGEAALPLVLGLTVLFTFLWYLLGVTRSSPTMNAGVTLLAVLQVGLLGSFGALILTLPNGRGVLFGAILATATNDIGALLIGQQVGRAPVAPSVSPNKTIEGVVGGAVTSVILTVLVLKVFGVDPWSTGSAIALALSVAVAAPLGDLAESMIKRDLGIKDMGTVLPGHGGLLDRFDGLLFALPVVYYLCR